MYLSCEQVIVKSDTPSCTINTSGFRYCEIRQENIGEDNYTIGGINVLRGETCFQGSWSEVIVTDDGQIVEIRLSPNLTSKDRMLIIDFDDFDIYNRFTLIQSSGL